MFVVFLYMGTLKIHSHIKMKKKLFNAAFKKAQEQSGKTTKHGLSAYLERMFMDDYKFSVNKVTFVRYYEKYVDGLKPEKGGNPGTDLLNKISEYLGYVNYEDFVAKNNQEPQENTSIKIGTGLGKKEKLKSFLKNHKVTLLVSSALIIIFITYEVFNKQRWMIWDESKYTEVEFNREHYNLGVLKIYNQEKIEKFKKIIPDCDTKFFKDNGEAALWYGKNGKGEVECFSTLGKHPVTGKSLKEISEYIVKKYFCENY